MNSSGSSKSPVKILEFSDFSLGFSSDGENVIEGVEFHLNRGECLGIVGESGSGKTLTCLSAINILPKSAKINNGEISYRASDSTIILNRLSEKEILPYRGAEIAVIFQEPLSSFNPSMRCGRQIAEMLKIHMTLKKQDLREHIMDLFRKVELPDPERIYKSYPHELSGGQLQRVMIAMAISCEPKILIADEPTTALDVTIQQGILELLTKLKREFNMAILFISHDIGAISRVSDRLLIMKDGQIVERGNTAEVLTHPKHPYTKGLLLSRPSFQKDIKFLPVFKSANSEVVDAVYFNNEEAKKRHQDLANEPRILEVEGLNVKYISSKTFFGKPKKHVRAVHDASFYMPTGETLGLVGESGSGKSSIAKAILRLTNYDAESIKIAGLETIAMSERDFRKVRKDVQVIFQDPFSSLNPRMKIGQAITEPAVVHKINLDGKSRRQYGYELLSEVGLEAEHFDRYPHEFSGGQRQRICIARAISSRPKLIICDECVSALDVSIQAQVLNLLVRLRERYNLSYLFISHDLAVVHFISDRIAVMKDGHIIEIGSKDEVFQKPKTDYTRRLINSIPRQ